MNKVFTTAEILLPGAQVDSSRWAVVACDQYTSQPDYWNEVEKIVGDAPSTLRLTLPEIYLGESDTRVPAIHENMKAYLANGTLNRKVNGLILIERTTEAGIRHGLIGAVDLEQYDYSVGSTSPIRATEGTVIERVPPRARIRAGAPLELPHVMMLIDDPKRTVIEPAYETCKVTEPLYDFELMAKGGRLRGWEVDKATEARIFEAIDALALTCDDLLFSIGDGNHSLAAARKCWLDIRDSLTDAERAVHPARYALVELVNLNCDALVFEPIHRILTGITDTAAFMAELAEALKADGIEAEGTDITVFDSGKTIGFHSVTHPLAALQRYLDSYVKSHAGVEIDYIHGDDALKSLVSARKDAVGLMPRALDKSELFPAIRANGVLPRKTFSMGEANEKRYYMEARKITL